jgi:CDP-glycerol glycerophosphotransferase (TagB/SpsB family)
MKIYTGYWEYGNIPDTYSFDFPPYGQMGESEPAVDYKKFKDLPVSESEIIRAEEISENIYKNKKNRYFQTSNSNEDLISEIQRIKAEGKKVIFYAGQNDFDSGLVPYNNTTEEFHSPIFKSTLDVLNYLLENVEPNGWHIVFKPHRLIYNYYPVEKFNNKSLTYVNYESALDEVIDICDVTCTILSTVAYDALFRNKPVVMFGFTALKGKGCTYEIFEKNKTVKIINESLQKGYTDEQKRNFYKHIAGLLKYYLYSDSIQNCLGNNMQKLISQLAK